MECFLIRNLASFLSGPEMFDVIGSQLWVNQESFLDPSSSRELYIPGLTNWDKLLVVVYHKNSINDPQSGFMLSADIDSETNVYVRNAEHPNQIMPRRIWVKDDNTLAIDGMSADGYNSFNTIVVYCVIGLRKQVAE